MRFIKLLAVAIFAPAYVFAKSKEPWWDNDGNMCYEPEGSYKDSCDAVTLESTENGCSLSAQCIDDGLKQQINMSFPKGVLYKNVIIDDGHMEHSPTIGDSGCLTCLMPQGNFNESCIKSVVEPFVEDQGEVCIFSTYCDSKMLNMSKSQVRLRGVPAYSLNQIKFPAGVEYRDMKNYQGALVHPSGDLNKTEACYQVGDHPMMEDSAGNRFGCDRKLVAGIVATSLFLTLG